MRRHDPAGELEGLGASAFWAVFGVALAFGTFTSLFILLLPVSVVFLMISKWIEPVRAWLVPAGFVAVPMGWMATGDIDGGTGGWVISGVAVAIVVLVAFAFETRQRTPAR